MEFLNEEGESREPRHTVTVVGGNMDGMKLVPNNWVQGREGFTLFYMDKARFTVLTDDPPSTIKTMREKETQKVVIVVFDDVEKVEDSENFIFFSMRNRTGVYLVGKTAEEARRMWWSYLYQRTN